MSKEQDKKALRKIINLKLKDIPEDRKELFKELEKPLKAFARIMLKKIK